MSNHNCDECGIDLDKTYFCSDAHRMKYRRRGKPEAVQKPSEAPLNTFLEEMRSKTAEIIAKPQSTVPDPIIFRGRPQGPQAPPPDKFFEEPTITTD